MAAISGMLGVGGGAAGSGFATPQRAPIQSPVTDQQATDAYTANQNALAQQQQFLQALQAQQGIQNQSNVYNQLQNVAAGQGPNPAQAQLAQATGANVANQAALMAGQRGASANVGLMARQAAQRGAQTQQQSAGQAATLQAQQSLGALGQMGGIAGQQVAEQQAATGQLTAAQQSEQQNLLNSIAGVNNANVSSQNNINTANTGLAGQQLGATQGLVGGGLQALGMAGLFKGASGSTLANGIGAGGGVFSSGVMDGAGLFGSGAALTGGELLPAVGEAAPLVASAAEGGEVPDQEAAPAIKPPEIKMPTIDPTKQPVSKVGQFLNNMGSSMQPQKQNPLQTGMASFGSGLIKSFMAEGGRVPALVSPGEQYLPPKDVKKVKEGANPLSVGERIPGKPQHPGNDYRNDTVKKTLKSGGVVIPNNVMQSKDPKKEAAKFVQAVLAKKGKLK